jgi:hypothetical protein
MVGCLPATAQTVYDGNNNLPPFGGFSGGQFDTVSLQNGTLHFEIPLASVTQRGGSSLTPKFIYDTPQFTKTTTTLDVQHHTQNTSITFNDRDYFRFVGNVAEYGLFSPITVEADLLIPLMFMKIGL